MPDLRIPAVLVIAALLAPFAMAQSASPSPSKPADTLLVFGEGFLFSMKEPEGWHCICDEEASKYQVNAIIFPSSSQSRVDHVAIRVRVNEKTDENTIEDLKADMQDYKKNYPKVQFADLAVAHPEYKTYAKLFQFPGDFYDYVAYVNPGPQARFTLSVSMTKQKTPATAAELAAYAKVVQSLHVFTKDELRPH
jgi:hypothetical protein